MIGSTCLKVAAFHLRNNLKQYLSKMYVNIARERTHLPHGPLKARQRILDKLGLCEDNFIGTGTVGRICPDEDPTDMQRVWSTPLQR